jgi:hypothetical protein
MRIKMASVWLEAISVMVAVTGVFAVITSVAAPRELPHRECVEMSCIGEFAALDPHDCQVCHNGARAAGKTPPHLVYVPSLCRWSWLRP